MRKAIVYDTNGGFSVFRQLRRRVRKHMRERRSVKEEAAKEEAVAIVAELQLVASGVTRLAFPWLPSQKPYNIGVLPK